MHSIVVRAQSPRPASQSIRSVPLTLTVYRDDLQPTAKHNCPISHFKVLATLELDMDEYYGRTTLRATLSPPLTFTTHSNDDMYMDVVVAGEHVGTHPGYLRLNKIFNHTLKGSFFNAANGNIGHIGNGDLSVARITGFQFGLEHVRDIHRLYHGTALFLVLLRAYVKRHLAAFQIARWWLRVSSDPSTVRGSARVIRRLAVVDTSKRPRRA
jgi:hypothetical protein